MAADIRTQKTPKVSVIIPAYNHERFVSAAVESVRSQTLADFELIIIDDGSTDRTLQVLEGIADPRIRLVSQENRGAAGTINRGIGLSRCPYIAILNSDDVYHPERLARMTQLLDDRPDVMLVSSLVEPIEASGSPVQPTSEHAAWRKWYEDALQQIRDDEPPLQSMLKYNYVVSSSNIVMRRSFFDSHRGFNERLVYCHDYELLLRVSRQYPVEVLRERLVCYRLHEANTINQNAFLKHLEILYCLFTTMDMDDLLAKPSPAERSTGDLYRGLIENPEINPAIRLSEWNAMLETKDRQLRQAHTQLQQADEQLQREDARLQQAYTQLQQADTWLRDVQSQLKVHQELLEAKDRQLYETGQRLGNLSAQLETKERLLQEIYASKGWRWLTRYRRLKAFFGIAPSKKPKIIHAIANIWLGGSSRLIVDLIEHLGHRYDQEVVTYDIPDPPVYHGFPCHDFSQLSSPDALAAFLREKEAKILHVHYWGEDNKPWYEHVFGAADLHPCLVIENVNTPVETYFHDKIKQYVYVSEFARKLYGPVPDDSCVIYPGSNLDLFRRLDHDVPDDTIGMVYRLERDKLNEESIDVFIDVVKERPSTTAYIIGGGTFFNLYQEKVRAAGVFDRFIFTGYVPYESLPDYYRKFSLFVAPVWKESFGQVSTFAMSMGIPVVGYNVGGLPEMLGTQEFCRNDRAQLASLIIDLLDDRKKRIEVGMSNCKRAHELFSVEAMIAKYDRLYNALLREGDNASKLVDCLEYPIDMKVLFPVHVFFPKHFYGTETYTLELAQSVKKMGHEPIILTALPLWEESTKERFYFTYEYDGLPVHCLDFNLKPHTTFRQIYYRPDLYAVYDEILDKIQPDIVHVTHIINHTGTLLEVLRDRKIPTIATLTDFFGICFNAKLNTENGTLCSGPNAKSTNCLRCYLQKADIYPLQRLLGKRFMKNRLITYLASRALPYLTLLPWGDNNLIVNHVLDVTERVDLLRRLYGTYRYMVAPTDFLYEAYEANHFYPAKLNKINFGINRELVKAYQTPRKKTDSRIRFGFIGQISEHKGVDLLINSYLRIKSDKISLSIYGSPDQDSLYMQELLRLSSTGDHIKFCGTFPREELPARLSELDVLVIPSRWYENSPLVLLYALATRTPVIVTDVKGMSEFVQDGVNGYTFQKNSVEQLTTVMQRIVDDPSSVERLSQNAVYLKDVSDHADDVFKLYTAALGGQSDVLQGP